MLRCERWQHVEVIAIRVPHHDPVHIWTLSHVRALSAERLKPGDLRRLILGPKIQVQPVLVSGLFRHAKEQQIGYYPVLRTA